jgi:hypothetical protein
MRTYKQSKGMLNLKKQRTKGNHKKTSRYVKGGQNTVKEDR